MGLTFDIFLWCILKICVFDCGSKTQSNFNIVMWDAGKNDIIFIFETKQLTNSGLTVILRCNIKIFPEVSCILTSSQLYKQWVCKKKSNLLFFAFFFFYTQYGICKWTMCAEHVWTIFRHSWSSLSLISENGKRQQKLSADYSRFYFLSAV